MRWKCTRENWILVYFLLAAVKFLCWNVALRMSVQNNLPSGVHDFCCQSKSCQAGTKWILCCPTDRITFDTEDAQGLVETSCQSPACLAHCRTGRTGISGQVGEGTYSPEGLFPQRKVVGLQVIRSHWGKQFFLSCIPYLLRLPAMWNTVRVVLEYNQLFLDSCPLGT